MENIEQERHSGLKLTIILLYIFAFGALTVLGSEGDIKLNMDNMNIINMLKIAQAVAVILIFILPAVLFATLWTKQRIHYLGFTVKTSVSTILIAGIGMLLAMPMINWLSDINQQMHLPSAFSGIEAWMKHSEDEAAQLTDAFTKGTSIGTLILNLFVIAFMAAVSEEIFFRGMLQKVLIECTKNKHVGIWIGAALFSAFHMQFFGFVPRILMGAYLGYMFQWSGSLLPGMIAHFINNGVAVYLAWLENRGAISTDADKIGVENNQWIYVILSTVMVILSLILVYKKEKKKTSEIINTSF